MRGRIGHRGDRCRVDTVRAVQRAGEPVEQVGSGRARDHHAESGQERTALQLVVGHVSGGRLRVLEQPPDVHAQRCRDLAQRAQVG
jgi:hypothetical protein